MKSDTKSDMKGDMKNDMDFFRKELYHGSIDLQRPQGFSLCGRFLLDGDVMARRRFYNSTAWSKCRNAYIQSVFGICERCHMPAKIGIVHHKQPITDENESDPSITLDFDNLEYLCIECHNREHFGGNNSSVRDGLMFDSTGQLVCKA
ncbi:MAG: HNH endonuclease [Cloacibacillus sp.]